LDLKGRKIVVGVTGGIAAYKSAELVSLLVKAGASVRVAMTANATRFVGPTTFEALTGNRVIWDMYGQEGIALEHIRWGQDSDLVIVAPATANLIAKYARGIADDFLTTMLLAATAKVLVCPSMNTIMLAHPATRENIEILKGRSVFVLDPAEGPLACGTTGPGRLPEPSEILDAALYLLTKKDLLSLKVLVTAGPTVEALDPVRFISNRSTGKMGYALAAAARARGADVVLISGPTNLKPPQGVKTLLVESAAQMREAVLRERIGCDIIIKAAAVSDYRPGVFSQDKIKKGPEKLVLELMRNPDILAELGAILSRESVPGSCVLVGFAAETRDLMENARAKLEAKGLHMIVANDVSRKDAGFAADTNIVKVLYRDGRVEELPLMEKRDVADMVLDRAEALRRSLLGYAQ
jgi:phosphopantothenoylcysteine decarboxylase/phosphopantothenate--cysteine ligase